VLDLAILGLLKDQPLHGYELRKRLPDALGVLWGISFGSLYPALRRLERDGLIEIVDPGEPVAQVTTTGSLSGDLAAARLRRRPKTSRRTRKAYRITERGDQRFRQLLLAEDPAGDEERAFTLRLAFCRHLEPIDRLGVLERRRAVLAGRLATSDSTRAGAEPGRDRYLRSLLEHRAQSTARDLEWIDSLISTERQEGASSAPTMPQASALEPSIDLAPAEPAWAPRQGATTA
jgi:DNA-binding PadR family transcriptional regulator